MDAAHKVSVIIPIGPFEANQKWLSTAIESCQQQTYPVDQILLIDDMAGMPFTSGVTIWHSPWRIGVAAAMNIGVAVAANDLVFMMASDDWLEPNCIEQCVLAYQKLNSPGDTYFFVGVRYWVQEGDNLKRMEGSQGEQFVPCGAAMVTKRLWRNCGGFPLEASSGSPDAALISIMFKNSEAGKVVGVGQGHCLYNYRVHPDQDTASKGSWQRVILETRDLVTQEWKVPQWKGLQKYRIVEPAAAAS